MLKLNYMLPFVLMILPVFQIQGKLTCISEKNFQKELQQKFTKDTSLKIIQNDKLNLQEEVNDVIFQKSLGQINNKLVYIIEVTSITSEIDFIVSLIKEITDISHENNINIPITTFMQCVEKQDGGFLIFFDNIGQEVSLGSLESLINTTYDEINHIIFAKIFEILYILEKKQLFYQFNPELINVKYINFNIISFVLDLTTSVHQKEFQINSQNQYWEAPETKIDGKITLNSASYTWFVFWITHVIVREEQIEETKEKFRNMKNSSDLEEIKSFLQEQINEQILLKTKPLFIQKPGVLTRWVNGFLCWFRIKFCVLAYDYSELIDQVLQYYPQKRPLSKQILETILKLGLQATYNENQQLNQTERLFQKEEKIKKLIVEKEGEQGLKSIEKGDYKLVNIYQDYIIGQRQIQEEPNYDRVSTIDYSSRISSNNSDDLDMMVISKEQDEPSNSDMKITSQQSLSKGNTHKSQKSIDQVRKNTLKNIFGSEENEQKIQDNQYEKEQTNDNQKNEYQDQINEDYSSEEQKEQKEFMPTQAKEDQNNLKNVTHKDNTNPENMSSLNNYV